jgi:ethanolamine utilization microcompartment shell protein EutL
MRPLQPLHAMLATDAALMQADVGLSVFIAASLRPISN